MTLLDEVKAAVQEEGNAYPDSYTDIIEGAEIVRREYLDSLRWANILEAVIKRGDEYVAVRVMEPATEMQEWGQYGANDVWVFEVVPKEVTTVKYVRA